MNTGLRTVTKPIVVFYVVEWFYAVLYFISLLSQVSSQFLYMLHFQGTAQTTDRTQRSKIDTNIRDLEGRALIIHSRNLSEPPRRGCNSEMNDVCEFGR
jgi:hypothetical protein